MIIDSEVNPRVTIFLYCDKCPMVKYKIRSMKEKNRVLIDLKRNNIL